MAVDDRAWRSAPVVAWVLLLTGIILGPLWRPGYVLRGDMVATPQQYLVPDALGVGTSLPRAVPMDAVLALATVTVDGAIVQRVVLAASLVLAGLGAARLAPGGRGISAAAATLMLWNPFVAERLLMGHWGLLLAYGAVPWAVAAALQLRAQRPGAAWRLLLWMVLAGLTPPGGVVAVLAVVPTVLWPGSPGWRQRSVRALLVALVANLPWVLPAVLHPSGGIGDPDAESVFAARADTDLGVLGSLLGLGGVWDSDAWPASRAAPTAAVFIVVVLVAVIAGFPRLRKTWGGGAWGLVAASTAGVVLAMGAVWAPDVAGWALERFPGVGLLRDGQRLVVPLAVLVATTAPLGVARLLERLRPVEARRLVAGGLMVLPLVVLPDLAWGLLGRLAPATYPNGWVLVRDELAATPDDADVISLPWQTFRQYPWNDNIPVLDPLPRFVDRVVVSSSDLPVQTPEGVLYVQGEDERAARVGDLVRSGRPLAATMPTEGIGWAVVQTDTPGTVEASLLRGGTVVVRTPSLLLVRLTDDPVDGIAPAAYAPLVLATDVGVVLLVAAGLVLARRRSPGTVPTPR